jgi:hypothetical protein
LTHKNNYRGVISKRRDIHLVVDHLQPNLTDVLEQWRNKMGLLACARMRSALSVPLLLPSGQLNLMANPVGMSFHLYRMRPNVLFPSNWLKSASAACVLTSNIVQMTEVFSPVKASCIRSHNTASGIDLPGPWLLHEVMLGNGGSVLS